VARSQFSSARGDLEAIEETLAIPSGPAAGRELNDGKAAIAVGNVATKDEIEALRAQLRLGSTSLRVSGIQLAPGAHRTDPLGTSPRCPSR
jgi:hypothetical protein